MAAAVANPPGLSNSGKSIYDIYCGDHIHNISFTAVHTSVIKIVREQPNIPLWPKHIGRAARPQQCADAGKLVDRTPVLIFQLGFQIECVASG